MINAGTIFYLEHGDGITRYRVMRHHRDIGYWECADEQGGIQIFSTFRIETLIELRDSQ